MKATAIANSNIAFVKYWGKKDEFRNIPMNPSISMTLDEKVSTKTTVEFSDKYDEDTLILDNERCSDDKLLRVSNFLDLIRKKANSIYKAKVVSLNSFPTGTGIASSASGFAALAAASSKALGIGGIGYPEEELSALARQGSGSAARSIYGGFVLWENEHAFQIKDERHWPELRDIIIILENKEKKISSREGMRLTVSTSMLYKERIEKINIILEKTKQSIIQKDFIGLANSIMEDSDNLHGCMADTTPKLVYMNGVSLKVRELVKEYNKKRVRAAYSFDAGPNAHIITLEEYVEDLKRELLKIFGVRLIVSMPGKGISYTEKHLF